MIVILILYALQDQLEFSKALRFIREPNPEKYSEVCMTAGSALIHEGELHNDDDGIVW